MGKVLFILFLCMGLYGKNEYTSLVADLFCSEEGMPWMRVDGEDKGKSGLSVKGR